MYTDVAFDTEFLSPPKLGLAIMVAMSCVIALSAELLAYPWPVVSAGMSLAILFTGVAMLGVFLLFHGLYEL